jgi:dienelactone hydrolase
MRKKKSDITPGVLIFFITFVFCGATMAGLKTEAIQYRLGEVSFTGYLVYDQALTSPRPGVLVIHEWWGLNDYARRRAEMLAEQGYVALAMDMYGDGKVATHPDDARGFMNAVTENMPVAEQRFDKALSVLRAHPLVENGKQAAIGYCFGGGMVLHMARAGKDLAGVVSYHGSVATKVPAQKGTVRSKVRVFNGAADPFITAEQISDFKQEMEQAGVDYQFVNYPGVLHSFTNPDADKVAEKFTMPLAYDARADKDSWQQTLKFFEEIF